MVRIVVSELIVADWALSAIGDRGARRHMRAG